MYKVYMDNNLMYDPRIEELALITPVVKLEENKAGSFSFTIAPDHPRYDAIKRRKSVLQVFDDEELIFGGVCTEIESDFYKQKKVYCEGELSYLNDSIQRQARYQKMTVRGLLEKYISIHNAQVEAEKRFTVGIVTVTDSNDSLYRFTNMQSTMQELKEDLVDDLGGYFRVRHQNGVKYLDYLADSMNTNSQVIRLGENLVDFKSNLDTDEIATAIIPLGAKLDETAVEGLETRLDIKSVNNGLDYVYSASAVESFGWIYRVVEWDDVTLPANLKSKGQKYLSDVQFENMVIEAKAIDLHFVDGAYERFKLSDQIRVVSPAHGLDRFFRLTKQTLNLTNPENDTITLGKTEKVSLSAKTVSANESIKKTIESIVPSSKLLKQAKDNATDLITSAMGGYVYKTNSELYIMDTDNPDTAKKVWRWNINGLGYSATGINGPYGLAMTMDGKIVADFISTGTMYADRIKGGTLSLGGADNGNGLIRVHDANGNVVGFWDNSGIRMQNKDASNACDINDGYIYFIKDGVNNGGVGANDLITAGQALKTVTFKAYGDVIVFSHNNKPYYVINPNNKELTDNRYTDAHYFKGSVRTTGNINANGKVNASGDIIAGGRVGATGDVTAGGNVSASGKVSANSLEGGSLYVNGLNIGTGSYDSDSAILVNCGLYAYGSLGCSGTKYRVVDTEKHGKVGLNAFETAEAYFSDLGSGIIDESGVATICFDEVFKETIEQDAEYQVFLSRTSPAQVEWIEKKNGYFVVHGEPGATFDWMLCCKQKGYADVRLAPVNIVEPKKESEIDG